MLKGIFKSLHFFVYLIFCLSLLTCKSTDTAPNIANEIYKIAFFKTGSYWIYHSDQLNLTDTIKVTIHQEYEKTNDYIYKEVDNTLRSSYYHKSLRDFLFTNETSYARVTTNSYGASMTCFSLNTCSNILCPNDGLIVILYHYNVGGNTYDTVFRFTNADLVNKYYFVRNTGIVKRETPDTSGIIEWHLVDSKLLR